MGACRQLSSAVPILPDSCVAFALLLLPLLSQPD